MEARQREETAAKARAKAFTEETGKMALEIAGGDQGKLQRAVMSAMMKPEMAASMVGVATFALLPATPTASSATSATGAPIVTT